MSRRDKRSNFGSKSTCHDDLSKWVDVIMIPVVRFATFLGGAIYGGGLSWQRSWNRIDALVASLSEPFA